MTTSPFSAGSRWLCTPEGRARFYFVILRPGLNFVGKPSPSFKRCRIDIHPDDMNMAGSNLHGHESTYTHKHIKKCATLVAE